MDDADRPGRLLQRHAWRGFRRITHDDGQLRLWPAYVVGFWTYEKLPGRAMKSLRPVLDELRRKR